MELWLVNNTLVGMYNETVISEQYTGRNVQWNCD